MKKVGAAVYAKWAFVALGSVLVALFAAILLLVYTRVGTTFLVPRLIAWYDARIPGSIVVGDIGGRLGTYLELRDLRLFDRNGEPLGVIDRVVLDWQAVALIRKSLHVHEVNAWGVRVRVPSEDDSGSWSDLTLPDGAPKTSVGPELPLDVRATVVVHDIEATRGWGPDAVSLLSRGHLMANVEGEGSRATVEILDARGSLPSVDLDLSAAHGALRWDAPVVRGTDFVAHTNLASLEVSEVEFDLESRSGFVVAQGVGNRAGLEQRFETSLPAAPRVELRAEGSAADLSARVDVAVGDVLRARVEISGAVDPTLALRGQVDVEGDPRRWLPQAPGNVAARADLRLSERSGDMFGNVVLRCVRCGVDQPVSLELDGRWQPATETLDARVSGSLAGLRVSSRGIFRQKRVIDLQWRLETSDLRGPSSLVSAFSSLPRVGGSLNANGVCRSTARALQCRTDLDAQSVVVDDVRIGDLRLGGGAVFGADPIAFDLQATAAPLVVGSVRVQNAGLVAVGTTERFRFELAADGGTLDSLRVASVISPGPPLAIDLNDLRLATPHGNVELLRPSRVIVETAAAEVDDLRLRVGSGTLAIDGRLGRTVESSFYLRGSDVPLGLARIVDPELDMLGEIDFEARVAGTPTSPTMTLRMEGEQLGHGDVRIGRAELDADYRAGALQIEAAFGGPMLSRARVTGRIPLALDFSAPSVRILADRPVDVMLDAEGIDLARAQPLVGIAVRGDIDIEVALRGTPRHPEIHLRTRAENLRYLDHEIGSVTGSVSYENRMLEARVEVDGPLADRAVATANLAVDLGVAPLRLEPIFGRPATVEIAIEGLDLPETPGQWPKIKGSGIARASIAIERKTETPTLALHLRSRDIVVRDQEIGTVALDASYAEERFTADLRVEGQVAEQLVVGASVPVRVTRSNVDWLPDRPHRLTVVARGIRVEGLARSLSLPPASGELAGTVEVRGTAVRPELVLEADVEDFRWQDRTIGDLSVVAAWALGALDAELEVRGRGNSELVARGRVPIDVDFGRRRVVWRSSEPHEVEVQAFAVDDEMLAPLVTIPPPLRFGVSGTLEGRGVIDDFVIDASFGGVIVHDELGRLPWTMRLSADEDRQRLEGTVGPRGPFSARLSAETEIPVARVAQRQASLTGSSFTASLQSPRMGLEPFADLFPALLHDPRGSFHADVRAAGTLGEPRFEGELGLHRAAATIVPMHQRFKDVNAHVTLDGNTIHLRRLSLRSGDGSARASGWVRRESDAIAGELRVRTEDLPLLRPGLPYLLVDSRLRGSFELRQDVGVIDVRVDDTRVDVLERGTPAPKRIPTNNRVAFVDHAARRGLMRRPGIDPPSRHPTSGVRPTGTALPENLQLNVEIGDPIVIVGQQVDMRWDGGTTVLKTNGTQVASGEITAAGGTFVLLDNVFDIQRGVIAFSDGGEDAIDPYVSVVATTDTPEAQVVVTISGRLSAPNLELSSEPRMSESEILTLLVTGSTQSEDASQQEVQAKAANLLASFNNPELSRQLRDAVGIDRASIGFGESVDQPILSVGKRLSRKVAVQTVYHHNAPENQNDAEVRFEYRFKRNWVFETFFGNEAEGGLQLFWRKFFGKNRPAEPPLRDRMQQLRERLRERRADGEKRTPDR